jgi:hypothetical protein
MRIITAAALASGLLLAGAAHAESSWASLPMNNYAFSMNLQHATGVPASTTVHYPPAGGAYGARYGAPVPRYYSYPHGRIPTASLPPPHGVPVRINGRWYRGW